jgi:flagellar motility protein MotE (MotC chaperone)
VGNSARKSLKLQNIRSAEEYVVAGLLRPPKTKPFTGELLSFTFNLDPEDEKANKEASRWASDPKARQRINKALADKGYDASYILRAALDRAADRTDAIDRRISSYELRRMAALKTIEHYSETLARRLETVSSDVIEGEFTEAAE